MNAFPGKFGNKKKNKFSHIKVEEIRQQAGKRKSSKKKKDYLSREEYEKLRNALPTEKFRLMYDLIVWSGLRIRALLDLKVEDIIISKEKGRSKIRVQRGKGHKEGDAPKYVPLLRLVYIHIHLSFNSFFSPSEDLINKVKKWIKDKEKDSLLFTNNRGNPYR
jgi:integrase